MSRPAALHYALQGLTVGGSAAPVPHSDAAGQDALNGALKVTFLV